MGPLSKFKMGGTKGLLSSLRKGKEFMFEGKCWVVGPANLRTSFSCLSQTRSLFSVMDFVQYLCFFRNGENVADLGHSQWTLCPYPG